MQKWLCLGLSLFLTLLLVGSAQAEVAARLALPQHLSKFAFASCAKERKAQPIWNSIAATRPELFLFIGDNVYADFWKADGKNISMSPVTDVKRIDRAYAMLKAKPEFRAFRQSVPMLGTWDDHDYGANDAGKHFPLKKLSQQRFFDFFGFASNDPIRDQQGVYHARMVGQGQQRVQFIMLDTRYHRDDLKKNPNGRVGGKGPYIGNQDPKASMLGDEQWQWLENQLLKPAALRFIISSIQVVAYEHGYESWGTLPLERQRLYSLITNTRANGVVFLSGDRHLTEVSKDIGQHGAKVPYPIWDLTASGMTDDINEVKDENSFRQGTVYRGSHFATVDIKWHSDTLNSKIIFRALKESGQLINEQIIRLGDLQIAAR